MSFKLNIKTNESNGYSDFEEKLNVYSHLFGVFLSLIALILLTVKAVEMEGIRHLISFVIFGISLVLLYTASAMYHGQVEPKKRFRLKIFDHSAIYILIAGSYTPYALVTLSSGAGNILFFLSWSMAITGIILKVFFTGRFKVISTLMYLGMGWMVLFFIGPLIDAISSAGLFWLMAGGTAYSVGALIYLIKEIKFNHAIFHIFVLVGSICHFLSIYLYV